tara:strand:+ start:11 stop:358 length:348 start_codon:yes stop_codon:yes gene_type:complete
MVNKKKGIKKRIVKSIKKVVKKKSKFPKCIVKRHGVCQRYDEKKVYGAVYYTCKSAHLKDYESEEIAGKVCSAINDWIKGKKEVDSEQIFKRITKELNKHNKDVAFMYETHTDIS